jgi:hypothetical protein
MNRKQGALGRAAERLMDMDSPSYGDERERAVFTEASTFGMSVGIYASLGLALVTAILGQLLLPVVLLVLMAVPAWATIWYGSRHGIDVTEMANRASRKERLRISAWTFGGIVLTAAAMLYTVLVGHGLIPVPEADLSADGVVSSMVKGGLVGGIGGGLVGVIVSAVGSRRRKAAPAAADEDDLDD